MEANSANATIVPFTFLVRLLDAKDFDITDHSTLTKAARFLSRSLHVPLFREVFKHPCKGGKGGKADKADKADKGGKKRATKSATTDKKPTPKAAKQSTTAKATKCGTKRNAENHLQQQPRKKSLTQKQMSDFFK